MLLELARDMPNPLVPESLFVADCWIKGGLGRTGGVDDRSKFTQIIDSPAHFLPFLSQSKMATLLTKLIPSCNAIQDKVVKRP